MEFFETHLEPLKYQSPIFLKLSPRSDFPQYQATTHAFEPWCIPLLSKYTLSIRLPVWLIRTQ